MPLLSIEELSNASPIFRGCAGKKFAQSLLRLFRVEKVNQLYDNNYQYKGPEFASHVLQDIGVDYQVGGLENLNNLPEGAFITISNHPYGSIDGIILVDLFAHINPDFKVMVNNFLSRIEPLNENFIAVTPTGKRREAATKESIAGVRNAIKHLKNGKPLGIFPSGAVSDLSLKEGCIRDREWQEAIIRLIKKARVPIVPVRFFDGNSKFYYNLGLIDWKVRLLRLPSEVFNKRGKEVRVGIGSPILPQEQDGYSDINDYRTFLRESVYKMELPTDFEFISKIRP